MFASRIDDDLELRLLEARHAEELFQVIDDCRADLRTWLGWVDAVRSVADIEAFIRATLQDLAASQGAAAGIWHDGRLAGVVSMRVQRDAPPRVAQPVERAPRREGGQVPRAAPPSREPLVRLPTPGPGPACGPSRTGKIRHPSQMPRYQRWRHRATAFLAAACPPVALERPAKPLTIETIAHRRRHRAAGQQRRPHRRAARACALVRLRRPLGLTLR